MTKFGFLKAVSALPSTKKATALKAIYNVIFIGDFWRCFLFSGVHTVYQHPIVISDII